MKDLLNRAKGLINNLTGKKDSSQQDSAPQTRMFPVIMPDGSMDYYPENFVITDGIHCFVCTSKYYHTHFDCYHLIDERDGKPYKGMTVKDAINQGYITCQHCYESSMEEEY